MAGRAQNFVWQRVATNAWLAENDELLRNAAPNGIAVIERPARSRILIESFCENPAQAKRLTVAYGGRIRRLPSDWQKTMFSRPARAPIRIGNRLVVVAESGELKSLAITRQVLIIPAAAAFGTGEHSTTAMCLRFLEEVSRKRGREWSLLDLGTGSGILALAAERFGADSVLALDNDPLAISTAKENARLNRIARVRFKQDDVLRLRSRSKFDVITANLFSGLLTATLPIIRRLLRRDGVVIVSGILRTEEKGIRRALHAEKFRVKELRRRGKWIAILAALREEAG